MTTYSIRTAKATTYDGTVNVTGEGHGYATLNKNLSSATTAPDQDASGWVYSCDEYGKYESANLIQQLSGKNVDHKDERGNEVLAACWWEVGFEEYSTTNKKSPWTAWITGSYW